MFNKWGVIMDQDSKAFDLFKELYNNNYNFKNIVDKNMENGSLRFFNDEEWNVIKLQNFVSDVLGMNEFIDMFTLGYNIGNCAGASVQLSYSYDDVDIVSGILPILKGTRNAEKEGGHVWLERKGKLIDTSLMLVMDISLKKEFGYIEEQRLTSFQLANGSKYQARKEFVNDKSLKRSSLK